MYRVGDSVSYGELKGKVSWIDEVNKRVSAQFIDQYGKTIFIIFDKNGHIFPKGKWDNCPILKLNK